MACHGHVAPPSLGYNVWIVMRATSIADPLQNASGLCVRNHRLRSACNLLSALRVSAGLSCHLAAVNAARREDDKQEMINFQRRHFSYHRKFRCRGVTEREKMLWQAHLPGLDRPSRLNDSIYLVHPIFGH